MRFTIEKAAFAKALAHVGRVVERRNTYPILANVHLSAEPEGRIVLRATDLDIEITEPVPATVTEPGTTTVPSSLLGDIVRKMAEGAEVTFEEKDGTAAVKAGRSRFSLACLSPESFPELKAGEYSHRFEMAGKELARVIAKTSFAISTEETRYYLNGIYFHTLEHMGNQVLRGVSTDGHRLARCECPAPDGSVGMPGIILPRKTVGELAKLLDGVETVAAEVSTNKIRFTLGGIVLVSKLIEGTFPDYQRVTPELSNTVAEVDIADLVKALDRVSVVATDRGGKAVKFALKDNLLELEVTNVDHGSSNEDLSAVWGGDPAEIGFNARYCADVLGALTGKTVKISIKDSGSPTRFFTDDDPSALFVLMPMRV